MKEVINGPSFFSYMKWSDGAHWGLWFRVFGWGLSISNTPLPFSQRNGYGTPFFLVGSVAVYALKPSRF